jgi:ferrochelatase
LIPCFLSPKTSHAPRSRQTTQRNAITDPEKSVGASSGEKDGVRENTKPTKPEKVGVLLLNLGGPEKLEDVQPFLFNLFADPDIIRLPGAVNFLQQPLAALLSANRAPKSREAYASIGGGSPLRRITDAQAEAMKNAMVKKGELDTKVYVGMRYWKPFTEDEMQHTVIPSWYQRPGYVQSMAQLIKGELENPARGFFEDDKPVIFFSAHGVPVSYVESAGDPYKEEMERCVELIMKQLKTLGVHNEHVLAYQSRVGPVEWLKPYTDDVIRDLGKNGTKAMVAVPVSFVSEHIETLEEIDMEYRELAQASGIERWGRAPALDTDKTFIDDLADACLESLATMRGESPAVAGGPAVEDGYESAYDISKSLDVELPDGTKAKKSFGTNLKPPVAMMPAGSGSGAGVPSVGDLLGGFHPEPWRWGILELSFVAVAILLSTMLLMDADTGAGLNETLFR